MKKNLLKIIFIASSIISLQLFNKYENYFSAINEGLNEQENDGLKSKTEEIKERDEYFFNTYRDPFINSIPSNIREMELSTVKNFQKAEHVLLKGSSVKAINWKEAGPFDVGGRTRAVVIDLDNSNTIIAGAVSGGIWKTSDKGITWKMKSKTNQILSITLIAQDPRMGFRNNLFAVGGEYRGNSASVSGASFYGAGLYKSTDKGESWNLISTNLTQPTGTSFNSELSYAAKIIISPTTGYLYMCANASGILRSTDYGLTWGETSKKFLLGGLNNHSYSDIAVNKNGLLVAAISQSNPSGATPTNSPGIYKSSDNGDTWTNITPSAFPATHARSVIGFIPAKPESFYVYSYTNKTNTSNNREIISLFRINSSNGVSTDLSGMLPDISSSGYINTQGNYDMAIAVHPTNENIVLIAGSSMFRSLDGFTTKISNSKNGWIGGYNQSYFNVTSLHPDIHIITFDENNPNEVWVGHDGGLSYTNDITNTNYSTYFPLDNRDRGYAVTQFYTASQSSKSGDTRIAGGTQDNGTPFLKFDGITTPSSTDVTGGDGAYCYFGNSYFFGSIQNGSVQRLGYLTNGIIDRDNWAIVTPDSASGQLFINPFIIDPSKESYMFYLAGKELWRNNAIEDIPQFNNKKTMFGWTRIKGLIPTNYTITTLAMSRSNPASLLYFGAYSSSGQPKIYRMDNSFIATEASEITPAYTGNSSGQIPNGTYPFSIAVNPQNGLELMVAFSNYNVQSLWYSSNGGLSWTDVEGNMSGTYAPSIRAVSILPVQNGKLFLIGTTTGVYSTLSLNGSNTNWVQEGADVIGNVVVDNITSRDTDGRIVVATHGRGFFVGNATVTSVEINDELPNQFTLEQNYPNPFNPNTTISFQLSAISNVTLKVYDILGNEITTLVDKRLNAGKHKVEFDASKLASGVYIYNLTAGSYTDSKKMLLLK